MSPGATPRATKVRKASLGRKNSEEMKEKMINLIRTKEIRAKLSQNLTNYNLSKGHRIEITNVEENTMTVFDSISKAAISLNTNPSTIRNYIKNKNSLKACINLLV